jgi:hypothetical protein
MKKVLQRKKVNINSMFFLFIYSFISSFIPFFLFSFNHNCFYYCHSKSLSLFPVSFAECIANSYDIVSVRKSAWFIQSNFQYKFKAQSITIAGSGRHHMYTNIYSLGRVSVKSNRDLPEKEKSQNRVRNSPV